MAKATEPKINQNQKEKKKMKKVNWETVKTVIIAVLITAIVAFVGGMRYQSHQNDQVKTEASSLVKMTQVSAKATDSSKQ